VGVYEK
jgi:protein phosphatase PTC1